MLLKADNTKKFRRANSQTCALAGSLCIWFLIYFFDLFSRWGHNFLILSAILFLSQYELLKALYIFSTTHKRWLILAEFTFIFPDGSIFRIVMAKGEGSDTKKTTFIVTGFAIRL